MAVKGIGVIDFLTAVVKEDAENLIRKIAKRAEERTAMTLAESIPGINKPAPAQLGAYTQAFGIPLAEQLLSFIEPEASFPVPAEIESFPEKSFFELAKQLLDYPSSCFVGILLSFLRSLLI